MKKEKIIYWTSTALVGGMMLFSAYSYLTSDMMKQGFQHLGFSDSFRIELAIAKILGAFALLLPMVPSVVKQFAYFGFALTFISAAIAHSAVGDPAQVVLMPLIFLAVLLLSYIYWKKIVGVRASQKSLNL